ncbi:ATP-binding protein [Vallitalea pronyensis]|nr:ATP-binding protein [Vallitalea pronyensis]
MMKELSMHILDIAQNSVRAKAHRITITVKELVSQNIFQFVIEDDGPGIPETILQDIRNPFTTSRTMRRVGLGIPFLEDTCNMCDGTLQIDSASGQGTTITATMCYDHIDRPPIGDMWSTIATLISSNAQINIKYEHYYDDTSFDISTNDLKEVLGDDVPLTDIQVIQWLKNYLKENMLELKA